MTTYHSRIMNIPRHSAGIVDAFDIDSFEQGHRRGHKDAKHAAADIAGEADAEIARLQAQVAELRSKLNEVHSWIVCAAIASPDDMMQYAQRIEEITRPETACTYPACACDGPAADGGCANPAAAGR